MSKPLPNLQGRVLIILIEERLTRRREEELAYDFLITLKMQRLSDLFQAHLLGQLFDQLQHFAGRLLTVKLLNVEAHVDLNVTAEYKVLIGLLLELLIQDSTPGSALGNPGVVEIVVGRGLLRILQRVINGNDDIFRQIDEVQMQRVEVDDGALPADTA